MTYVNINFDIEDILSEMSIRDLQDLADTLYEEGYVPSQIEDDSLTESYGIINDLFSEALDKLSKNRLSLTLEEETLILNLASKF
jgi:predicted ATP-dependent Lon-type protease